MQIGVLVNKDGVVKRTWALITGSHVAPLEDGDEIIEWTMAHGHDAADHEQREAQTSTAIAMQDALSAARTREHALHISAPHAEVRTHRRFLASQASADGRETFYHSEGRLVNRTKGSGVFSTHTGDGRLEHVTDTKETP